MIKKAFISVILLAGMAVAQTGTRPDPVAGQSSTQPTGAPTNTPQAQQQASPAAKPQPTQQNNAANTPAETAPKTGETAPPPTNSNATAPEKKNDANAAPEQKNTDKPQTTAAPNVAHVELTPPVTGAPETKIFDSSAVGKHAGVTGAADPLLDVPPPPKGKPTLIGGLAVKVDRIHSRVTVEPFGAKNKMRVFIDERSHIYRNGVETTLASIKKGDRVYFDTLLDGPRVFAKNVRVISETGGAEVRGQITSYDARKGIVQMQDALSSRPVTFRVTPQTTIKAQGGNAAAGDLAKGALVDVVFAPDKSNRGIATEITMLARPGTSYTFAGIITNVNVRDGVVSVENRTDEKVYDIEFDPRSRSDRSTLRVGSSVNIVATFDGENYRATNVTVTDASAAPQSQAKPKASDDRDQ